MSALQIQNDIFFLFPPLRLIQKLLLYPMPNVCACTTLESAVQNLQAVGCSDDSVISGLFERAAALAGSENDSLWLQWAKHELQCGNAKSASRVHFSAVRALRKVDFRLITLLSTSAS